MELKHTFIESAPDELDEKTIYVSILYKTVLHKCVCGCGNEVVTPLSPTDWRMTFDGESISLFPSIGNWSFPCRSHYWVRGNNVEWAEVWTDDEVRSNRRFDRMRKVEYETSVPETKVASQTKPDPNTEPSIVERFTNWLRRRL